MGKTAREMLAAIQGRKVEADAVAPVPPPIDPRQSLARMHEYQIVQWQGGLYEEGRRLIREPAYRERDSLMMAMAAVANNAPQTSVLAWPVTAGSQEELEGALAAVAAKVLAANGVSSPTVPAKVQIGWESFDLAVQANEAYLSRTPVIDRLCYSSAVSMITGGKHAGKSTLARWMAICVVKGMPFLKRDVIQGPVFYIASEDETMPARQELIRLGWGPDDPLRFFSSSNMPTDDPLKFLHALADEIKVHRVSLVVLDMLFDFVRIADEMSYAGTREAVGHIQQVASETGAHLVAIHHAPKNAAIGDAAVAALGSQGLAARVSPIILVRRFGPGVHSITSTSVRDPRGEALMESRLLRHEDGSVTLGGVWKTYMLAEAYSERVLDYIDDEQGSEVTAGDIAEGLDIGYPVARACLFNLMKGGILVRSGSGKKGKPFRYSRISSANEKQPFSNSVHVGGCSLSESDVPTRDQGRFGYKD